MAENQGPKDHGHDPEKRDPDLELQGLGQSLQRTQHDEPAKPDDHGSADRPKPSITGRLWRFFLRRRTWRKMAGHPTANWAERVTVFITSCILVVGIIQAIIYSRQAQIMQSALEQNDRSILLGRGQLIVANRNAATTESVLKESRDTLEIDQRPYLIGIEHPVFSGSAFAPNQRIMVNYYFQNIGKSPVVNEISQNRLFVYKLPQTAPQVRARMDVKFMTKEFEKLRERNQVVATALADLKEVGMDLAPQQHFFTTTNDEVILDSPTFQDLSSDDPKHLLFFISVSAYTDKFNNRYETTVCQFFFGKNPELWHRCDIFNTIK